MILILSNSVREASLLATLCEQRSWPSQGCTKGSEFVRLTEKSTPRVVVVRQRFSDGYSDDIFRWLQRSTTPLNTRIIVLVAADCSIQHEARQIALGADCVMRDPLRLEVLLAYLAKYRTKHARPAASARRPSPSYEFAGVRVLAHEFRLERSGRAVQVAPQVLELLRLLHHSPGKVAPYPVLYSELFNRKFTGDTSNCRVLLAKAATSFARLGTDLRAHIKVIPKSGYLYSPPTKSDPSAVTARKRARK